MGRIVTQVTIGNPMEKGKAIKCDALVDTGTGILTLPRAWKERLGSFPEGREISLETADQRVIRGEVCGPVRIEVEGFRPIYSEVLFIEMQPQDGNYEPLIGYIVLEQSQAAVDIVGHRLVTVKAMDLK